jgi:MoxR-like ATPase
MRLDLGYPDRDAERAMLGGPDRRSLLSTLTPHMTLADLTSLQDQVPKIHVAPALADYILDLLSHTRKDRPLGSGLSPRAGLALQRAAQAWALMAGRELVIPEDVQAVAPSVMSHRLRGADAHIHDGRALADAVIRAVPVP